jgi:hypothetical protein
MIVPYGLVYSVYLPNITYPVEMNVYAILYDILGKFELTLKGCWIRFHFAWLMPPIQG